jgi:hypothetical protein
MPARLAADVDRRLLNGIAQGVTPPYSGRKFLILIELRRAGVAKIVIQKDLGRRFVKAKNLAA